MFKFRSPAYAVVLVAAALLTALLPVLPTASAQGDDARFEQLTELALRLLQDQHGWPMSGTSRGEFFLGALPDRFQDTLPLPEGDRLIGSYLDPFGNLTVVLESPRAPAPVLEGYRRLLEEAGWQARQGSVFGAPFGFFSSDFVSLPAPDEPLTFCRQGSSQELGLIANPGRLTDVRLRLFPFGSCHESAPSGTLSAEHLPLLTVPPGAPINSAGSGGGETSFHATAAISSELGLDELLDHFAAQLEEHGWQEESRDAQGSFGLARLSLETDGYLWQAQLTVSGGDDSARNLTLDISRGARAN